MHALEDGTVRVRQATPHVGTAQLPQLQSHIRALMPNFLCRHIEPNGWEVVVRKRVGREALREGRFTSTAVAHDGHDEERRRHGLPQV